MKKRFFILLLIVLSVIMTAEVFGQQLFALSSPNGKLRADISIGTTINYSVTHGEDKILNRSVISMTLVGGQAYGVNPILLNKVDKTENSIIEASVYKKNAVVNHYNETTFNFDGDYQIIFRAYDDGIAYRFVSTSLSPFIVENEQATFNFPSNQMAYIPYVVKGATFEEQYYNSFENLYSHISLSTFDKNRLSFTPAVLEATNGKKVCIAEADLMNYPGMFLNNSNNSNSLKGVFAPYPKELKQDSFKETVVSRESYIAKYDKGTSFPWRVVIVSENDSELADNDMIFKLSTAPSGDFSWVKPGKAAWNWWCPTIFGVDFKVGQNTATLKYYIDFAALYGLEYVVIDSGWSSDSSTPEGVKMPKADINLQEIINYAQSKNVDIFLWIGFYPFKQDTEGLCQYFSGMGVKGFKVDFMDRDDQLAVQFVTNAAKTAAKYKMSLNMHGSYKPTGLQRTYPNQLNVEAVYGLEQMKWSNPNMVEYDVTIPFIRMVAGPVDYTQGALRNATKDKFRIVSDEPMSQGTRCHQLAEYVVFNSPMGMLCDGLSYYLQEDECTKFIASVPTVWDQTVSINGAISKYISIARKKGEEWYVGSMTNWDARMLILDLSFLGEGEYKAEIFRDGVNADVTARDYKREIVDVAANKKMIVSMAAGGGFAARIYPASTTALKKKK